ncbi:hypothetical protein [Roseiterribacter gracilis]|uniref:Uncharacterized protein n=1 Tax=Roseiterribacter gracilis TaxID=2812848 RepID=A0A8S8XE23_9PROT|nr:hypothetical protein TMPK1_18940 [Rhodospirillales bacterium TMPK1]
MLRNWTIALALALLAGPALGQEAPKVERRQIEIYRIAPGQHEAFLREIAKSDEIKKSVGLKPRELYVHQDGADWDFILIQPAEAPPGKSAELREARKKAGSPTSQRFFLEIRKMIAEHSDTVAEGPTTAGDWLARLDKQ